MARPCRQGLPWLVLVLHPAWSHAADTEDFEVWSSSAEAVEMSRSLEPEDRERVVEDWFVRVGIIGGYAPDYLGADGYEPGYAPTGKVVWRDRLFINDRSVGINLYKDQHVAVGGFARYTGGRSDNDEGLRGLGDISRTVTAGGFLNLKYKRLRFKAEVRHDTLDEDQGTVVISALGIKLPWSDPLFSLYLGSTWADGTYMSTFYGVDPVQSIRSGHPQFDAGAGFRDVSVSLSSGYGFGDHWQLSGQVQYLRLLEDAADSPIVDDSGSANQVVVGLRLSYTF